VRGGESALSKSRKKGKKKDAPVCCRGVDRKKIKEKVRDGTVKKRKRGGKGYKEGKKKTGAP